MVDQWLEKITQANKVILCKLVEWWDYYLIFSKPLPFISVLILVHAWIEYALIAILITHLTDEWLHLPKAASIVNVHDGVSGVMVLLVAYVSEVYLGPFTAILCTTISYISGLSMLFFSAWKLQRVKIQFLYVALMLIALGRAGRDIPLKEFLADQCRKEPSSLNENQVESRRKIWWRSAYILGIIGSIFLFSNVSWMKLSMISAIALAAAFELFLMGLSFYERKKPIQRNGKNIILQVMCAAILKRHLMNTSNNDNLLHIPMLSWLDKAAIVEPSPSIEEQRRKWRLCTVEEIQQVKKSLTMVPLWTTFLVYGLVQATGNTFFYEQANHMETQLGLINNVPVVIFVIVKSSTSFMVSRLCDSVIFPYIWGNEVPQGITLSRIALGMAISPICCVIASRIEYYRVDQSVSYEISISVFWLIPQFFSLGLMDGLVLYGLEDFFYTQVPQSFKAYGMPFSLFSLNIGHFLGIPLVLIFHDLFTDDLDTSRLGKYYGILAWICFGNLLFYCVIATFYVKEGNHEDASFEEELTEKLEFQNMCKISI